MVLPAGAGTEASLYGREGELISIRVTVEPRLLEDLLDTLAILDFPVNPELYHYRAEVAVEFPAYSSQIEGVRKALHERGFTDGQVEFTKVLARGQH